MAAIFRREGYVSVNASFSMDEMSLEEAKEYRKVLEDLGFSF
ncbi:MAG: hypothetical protein SVV03_05135 [Candidatus Nanohaloarchaea archaeon]|nr:hypothetical protein [Candidatus Nanohaloarchaea archaeon]